MILFLVHKRLCQHATAYDGSLLGAVKAMENVLKHLVVVPFRCHAYEAVQWASFCHLRDDYFSETTQA